MYGLEKKCSEQLQMDNDFRKECDLTFENRKKAAIHHIDLAWGYFYANHLDSSMMRFNQAWLLDSLNSDVYWGYGNLLGRQQKFEESLDYFDKSLEINPNNSNICGSN